MMRTKNPALNDKTFTGLGAVAGSARAMTIQGTVNKALMMLLLLLVSAFWVWGMFYRQENMGLVQILMWGGVIGGFLVMLLTMFKKHLAPITGPVYALLEGLALGGISAMFEAMYPGIVIQAVALTFGVLFSLLMAYKSRLIRVTENFKLGIVAATGGIFLVYMATMVLGFFGTSIPYIHGSGLIGIGFSLFVVVIAALNLVLDFDFIEKGAAAGAPKYMEWYGALGLMVTLIWLYIEILRLLSKLRSRR
jgi:uncharacterized YccA/Bax inhibitor family protein